MACPARGGGGGGGGGGYPIHTWLGYPRYPDLAGVPQLSRPGWGTLLLTNRRLWKHNIPHPSPSDAVSNYAAYLVGTRIRMGVVPVTPLTLPPPQDPLLQLGRNKGTNRMVRLVKNWAHYVWDFVWSICDGFCAFLHRLVLTFSV